MVGVLGQKIETSQLEFMADFAVRLTAFQQQLESRDLDPSFRAKILVQVQKAFDRLYDKLEKMTEEVIVKAEHDHARAK